MSMLKNKNAVSVFLALAAVLVLSVGWFIARDQGETIPPEPTLNQAPATPGEGKLSTAADLTAADPAKAQPKQDTPTPVIQAEGRFIGRPDAPVQMIEFASLSCNHCAHFHNDSLDAFRVKYVDTGKVRIEFRSFPLNQPALDGAKLLSCLPDAQFFPFMTMLYQTQDRWAFRDNYKDILKQNAKLVGLSDDQITACLDDKKKEDDLVQAVIKDVQKYKIQSTPTFILNDGAGKVVGGSIDALSKEIDAILNGTATPSSTPTPPATPDLQGASAP